MKILKYTTWAILLVIFAGIISTFAQVTNNPAAPFDPVVGSLPSTKDEFWKYAIAFITPLIIWAFGKIPQLPRPVLPLLTPLVGIGLGFLMNWLVKLNLGWVDMASMGAIAVFLRESVNQTITKQLLKGEESKTEAKAVDGATTIIPKLKVGK